MSLGSLTTGFEPAASGCLDPDVFWIETGGGDGEDGGLSMQQGVPYTQRPACYPRDYVPVSSSYYSPGVCPPNYTVACSSTLIQDSVPVTAHVCCPDVYWQWSCPSDDHTSILRKSPWLTTLGCWSSLAETTTRVITEAKVGSNVVATTVMSNGLFGAHAINVRFRDGDFSMSGDLPVPTQAHPAETASGTCRSLVPAPRSPSSATTSAAACSSPEDIPPGVAAGIAVGAAAGALLLVLLGWVLVRILKHRGNAKAARQVHGPASNRTETQAKDEKAKTNKTNPEFRGTTFTEPYHLPVAELGPSERPMSWENTWEHITVSPRSLSSPYTLEGSPFADKEVGADRVK